MSFDGAWARGAFWAHLNTQVRLSTALKVTKTGVNKHGGEFEVGEILFNNPFTRIT